MSEENSLTQADVRRARALCRVAAAVFAVCGLLLLAAPLSLPLRAVAGGFNFVVAVSVLLYAGTLRADP